MCHTAMQTLLKKFTQNAEITQKKTYPTKRPAKRKAAGLVS